MAVNNPQLPNPNQGSALNWLASWIAILLVVVLLARSSWGKPIVYYAMWLAIVFLVLTHASDFSNILAGGSNQNG